MKAFQYLLALCTVISLTSVATAATCRYSRRQSEHSVASCAKDAAVRYCYNVVVCDEKTPAETVKYAACQAKQKGGSWVCPDATTCNAENDSMKVVKMDPVAPRQPPGGGGGGGR